MTTAITDQHATVDIQLDASRIQCRGTWTTDSVASVQQLLQSVTWSGTQPLTIDGSAITRLDSAGAWLIRKIMQVIHTQGGSVELVGFSREQTDLIQLLQQQSVPDRVKSKKISWLSMMGLRICYAVTHGCAVLAFIGETSHYLLRMVCRPTRLHGHELARVIERTGYHALPIIALLAYLIGVVLAYQMGIQLKNYGANIYIVNLLGIAILREFGPLITAIIVAGRTGAAYTAEIGTMKVNEEIDALHTLGVAPADILSIPRIIGLIIVVPLLTIWADLFGLLGGMVMANSMLDIDFYSFLQEFQEVISFRTYYLGMIKAPVFALLIGGVGCYHGFRVKGGADSVGHETTKSVVHSIFLIIVADAIFSVIFGWQNI